MATNGYCCTWQITFYPVKYDIKLSQIILLNLRFGGASRHYDHKMDEMQYVCWLILNWIWDFDLHICFSHPMYKAFTFNHTLASPVQIMTWISPHNSMLHHMNRENAKENHFSWIWSNEKIKHRMWTNIFHEVFFLIFELLPA